MLALFKATLILPDIFLQSNWHTTIQGNPKLFEFLNYQKVIKWLSASVNYLWLQITVDHTLEMTKRYHTQNLNHNNLCIFFWIFSTPREHKWIVSQKVGKQARDSPWRGKQTRGMCTLKVFYPIVHHLCTILKH